MLGVAMVVTGDVLLQRSWRVFSSPSYVCFKGSHCIAISLSSTLSFCSSVLSASLLLSLSCLFLFLYSPSPSSFAPPLSLSQFHSVFPLFSRSSNPPKNPKKLFYCTLSVIALTVVELTDEQNNQFQTQFLDRSSLSLRRFCVDKKAPSRSDFYISLHNF